MIPTMTQNWSPNGVPKLSKIVKNDVLGQPLHTGGSKVASTLLRNRFWIGFGTIWEPFLTDFLTQLG